ncbi:MAG: D-tyrosyl-tRNA(Tyr) deacylase [Calditrichaeota bacterium]|nr:D-tyrosyl-tRNA(Tyr) deacylase [Calditrichota bacterium]
MRVVLQRVREASVSVEGRVVGRIERGYLLLIGFTNSDQVNDLDWMAAKVSRLRLFDDESGKMNLSLSEVGGSILAVPQFTLYAGAQRGRRPDFIKAAPPGQAAPLFERFCEQLQNTGCAVATGIFGAHMEVHLCNDGPVTILLESPPK